MQNNWRDGRGLTGMQLMRHYHRRAALSFVTATAAGLVTYPRLAFAGEFPDHAIKMIVPYPAGGPTDIMGRVVADFVGRDLKQSVVVENRPGANGSLGADGTAKAEPDGYTVMMTAGSVIVQNPLIYKKLTYDPVKDFRMLALMTDVPIVIVVHPSLPVKNIKDLVDYAKANPGKLNFGSAGIGGTTHLAGERFKYAAGVDLVHVPYKGVAPAMNDLLGGHIQLMFDTLSTSIPHIKSGALRPIAMATRERLKDLPDVPTVAESGYPDYVISVWFGVAGQAKMPDTLAATWTASLQRAMVDALVREQLERINYVMLKPQDPAAMTAFVAADRAAWAKVVDAQKISVE